MTGKGGIRIGEYCPHCGRALRSYQNPPRFVCETHGTIPGELVLRPNPADAAITPEERDTERRKHRKNPRNPQGGRDA